ncbi:MAG: hypothetical protein R3270_10945 [Gammaproteobacteria bacterium]|nr:hypothetical protein [Gammaproteobacteria bacterium]
MSKRIALLLIAFAFGCASCSVERNSADSISNKKQLRNGLPISSENFFQGEVEVVGPLSVDQVEQRSLERIHDIAKRQLDIPRIPFGYLNGKWVEMRSLFQPGDELYEFVASEHSPNIAKNYATRGIALVRGGHVIEILTISVH